MKRVILLATEETKASEIAFLKQALAQHNLEGVLVDLSLRSQGQLLSGADKIVAMQAAIQRGGLEVTQALQAGACATLGLGGGSGGEMVLRIMQQQPLNLPQVLVSTLPFDPRASVAHSQIILVPTLIDFSELNVLMRETLNRSAAIVAALVGVMPQPKTSMPSLAVSALGATQGAVDHLGATLASSPVETTVFHANGYGGAALVRYLAEGRFQALVELTPHELTRQKFAGACTNMPERFRIAAMKNIPQVLLPGGLNFIGLGPLDSLPDQYRKRPHYAHSGLFTHVKATATEMATLAQELAQALNLSQNYAAVLVPMRGFSHQDLPGGAIEDLPLRQVFLDAMRAHLRPDIPVKALDTHINQAETATYIVHCLAPFLKESQSDNDRSR